MYILHHRRRDYNLFAYGCRPKGCVVRIILDWRLVWLLLVAKMFESLIIRFVKKSRFVILLIRVADAFKKYSFTGSYRNSFVLLSNVNLWLITLPIQNEKMQIESIKFVYVDGHPKMNPYKQEINYCLPWLWICRQNFT